MKIALVSLGAGAGDFSQFTERFLNATVALYYIAEILKKADFEVLIVDQPNTKINDEEILTILQKENPAIILFSQFFTTRKRVRDLILQLRNSGINAIFGVGGHDATFDSIEGPGEYEIFDIIFQGPVLGTIVDNLKKVINSRNKKFIFNSLGKTDNPNLLPILEHDNYSGTGFLIGSFGCYPKNSGCAFCTTPQFCPSGWKGRKIESVFQEVKSLVKNGKKYAFLTDDDFLVDLERGHEIILGCREIGLDMMVMTKLKNILKANKKGYISQWTNVKRVFLGVENGSPRGLIELGKNTGKIENYLSECRKAFEIVKSFGKAPFAGHINFSGPKTSFSQLKESSKFLFELGECDWTALTQAWRPYPGTLATKNFSGKYYFKGGELVYSFNDYWVNKFHQFVFSLRSETDLIDNLIYSITDEIFIRNPNPEIWNQYWKMKKKWNKTSYKFFLEYLKNFEKRIFCNPGNFLQALASISKDLSGLYEKLS